MHNDTIDLAESIKVVRQNISTFILCIVLAVGSALILAKILPKQYKSKAILSIQSSYFQNPLVSDLVSQVTDPQELQSQRISLLRMALSTDYIDKLALKYSIYTDKAYQDARIQAIEREAFNKSIQYYSLSPTTFEITAKAKEPEDAKELTSDILEQMQQVLINERYETLAKTRQAVETHVRNLGNNIQKIASPVAESTIQAELSKVEAALAGLLIRFTDSHPEVQKLRMKQRSLKAAQPAKSLNSQTKPDDEILASGGTLAKQPAQEVYNDLLKKLNYLAIVLDMEEDKQNVSYLAVIEKPELPVSPIFPNTRLFLILGLISGTVLGLFFCVISELGRRNQLSPIQAANLLDAPLLGELPTLPASSIRHLVEYKPQPKLLAHQPDLT